VTEQIETSSKKVRGMAKASLDLIDTMHDIAEEIQPVTGRGIGYKLFSRGLLPDMGKQSMARVYRLLTLAREQDIIPWDWIVDETRELEIGATWNDPEEFIEEKMFTYRKEFWNTQNVRCILASEKGTVRGVLQQVLHQYGVGFLPLHGFNSATKVHDLAETDDSVPLILLYVGDYDPSGLCMSEADLPARIKEYGGDHVEIRRIALKIEQTTGLLSFPASAKGPKPGKKGDPRYKWFVSRYGDRCWELDAMDPRDLRACVEAAIKDLIDEEEWQRCETVNAAERESIREFLGGWRAFTRPQTRPDWIDEYLQASPEVDHGSEVSP
jgi:hypothetical protein